MIGPQHDESTLHYNNDECYREPEAGDGPGSGRVRAPQHPESTEGDGMC